jgi:hypothetical protein
LILKRGWGFALIPLLISLAVATDPPVGLGSRYPNIAETDRGFALCWFEPKGDAFQLKMSEYDGHRWADPVLIREGSDFFVNWADFPSIYYAGEHWFAAHWPQKSGDGPYDYDVKVSQSFDRGQSWTKPVTAHRDGKKGEHGFVSFFMDPKGSLALAWLDGRKMTAGHGDHGYGAMNLFTTTLDKSGNLGPETLLDDKVCECCPTSVAETNDGIVLAYRDRSDSEIRDMYAVRLSGTEWTSPAPIHSDNWKIAGCPVNGPKLATKGNMLASVWFTSPDETPQVLFALSNDNGKSFQAPIRLDGGTPIGRTDILWLSGRKALTSWMEYGEEITHIVFRTVSIDGRLGKPFIAAEIDAGRASGYPVITRIGRKIFLSWTSSGETGKVESKWIPVSKL